MNAPRHRRGDDGERRTPLTPIFNYRERRGSIAVGNSPGGPIPPAPAEMLTTFSGGGAAQVKINVSAVPDDSLMVAAYHSGADLDTAFVDTTSGATIGGGWTKVADFNYHRQIELWYRVKQSGDTTFTFDKTGINNNMCLAVVVFDQGTSITVSSSATKAPSTGPIDVPSAPIGNRKCFVIAADCLSDGTTDIPFTGYPAGMTVLVTGAVGAGSSFRHEIATRDDNDGTGFLFDPLPAEEKGAIAFTVQL
ncbi:MAG: hypothetical protein LC687_00465 [Actinobacteria bacterium]|nr:hypothetical protein [Actinomycetota bacterium]